MLCLSSTWHLQSTFLAPLLRYFRTLLVSTRLRPAFNNSPVQCWWMSRERIDVFVRSIIAQFVYSVPSITFVPIENYLLLRTAWGGYQAKKKKSNVLISTEHY